ncbi:hypothetical protein AAGG34_25705, partial [Citrobacter braakii]|uniref:hypothetical protein n=1 Tax=Citrobacter braakii TaxID=57706 RepID=UPI002DB87D94
IRAFRSLPTGGRPSLKRPHDGQRRVSFVLAGRPDSRKHGGNVFAERYVKAPRVKGGTPSHATRDQPL